MLANVGSAVAGLMFAWAMFQQYFPAELRRHLEKYYDKLYRLVYPFIQITFNEYGRDHFARSEAFASIETYLASSASASLQAKRLTAADSAAKNSAPGISPLLLTISDHEEIEDSFEGARIWWTPSAHAPKNQYSFSFYPPPDEKRYYKLTFHKSHRHLITNSYLPHVLKEGAAITQRNRRRKLYTNYGSRWNHVVFHHPSTFDSIAMDAEKKKEIVEDLISFSKSEDFYARIGRAWKRGYLLYGPPGTGKSSMIAAIANLLNYDVYDLELTSVKDNTELRKLLMQMSSKSVIVIEDIDCSLDLTGQRKEKKKESSDGGGGGDDDLKKKLAEDGESKTSKVTLSGLLNFIDGLWSACKGERLIVFTTNFKEKLDPALIRRGRMDKHIELSYCRFEAFRGLVKNYWGLEDHPKFELIGRMLEETDVTPSEVAECLMPKTEVRDVEDYLDALIEAIEQAKIDARLKAEEEQEAKKKAAEEEEKAKKKKAAEEEEKAKKKKAEEEEEEEEAKKKKATEEAKKKEGEEGKEKEVVVGKEEGKHENGSLHKNEEIEQKKAST